MTYLSGDPQDEEEPAFLPPPFDIAKDPIPSFAFLLEQRASLYSKRSDYDSFQRTIQELGSDGEAGRRRGLGHWLVGELKQAATALEAFPTDDVASFTRANALLSLGRPADAQPLFARLASDYPAEPRPWGGLVAAKLEADLLGGKEAEESALATLSTSLEAATESLRGSAEYHYLAGRAAELRNDLESALDHYSAAREVDPTHRPNLFHLAHLAERTGLDELALDGYESLISMLPIDHSTLMNLGVLYEDMGRDQEAAACYDTVVASDPTNTRARLYLTDARAATEMFYDEDQEKKEDLLNQVLRIPITDFELSVRARNSLNKMNILTLGDLVVKTEPELLSVKNFGETSLNEIKEILNSKRLRLGMNRLEAAASIATHSATSANDEDELAQPISILKLSIRARRVVENIGALTVQDICQHSEDELLGMPNFGATSLAELKSKLTEMGLTLRKG
ncbi:MAG: DNA-directed RNA polymerase subunit alpha [Planctomycetota bacterium]|jgi:DNA-directed RNA polymerase subunit alpha